MQQQPPPLNEYDSAMFGTGQAVAPAGASSGSTAGTPGSHHSQTQSPSHAQSFVMTGNGQSKSTLWMGELEAWQDEAAIRAIWASLGEPNVQVKLIRDKLTGAGAGYCFVDFGSASAARNALYRFNGRPMPLPNNNTGTKLLRLNWASGGGLVDKRDDRNPEFSVFVGDLASEVTEEQLLFVFQSRYPSCKSAKIMTDPQTNASRGYGFVRFADDSDMHRSLSEMNGYVLGSRPIRISTATPKNRSYSMPPPFAMFNGPSGSVSASATAPIHHQQQATGPLGTNLASYNMGSSAGGVNHTSNINGNLTGAPGPGQGHIANSSLGSSGVSPFHNQYTDPHNTTVFVGGLSPQVSEDELRRYFSAFGEIIYVRIPAGKGCGFVQYVERQSAEAAITQMQGFPLGNSRVRLSWGRSQLGGPSNNASMTATGAGASTGFGMYRSSLAAPSAMGSIPQASSASASSYPAMYPMADTYNLGANAGSAFAPVQPMSVAAARGHGHSFSHHSISTTHTPMVGRHRSVASQSNLHSHAFMDTSVPDATEPVPVARLNELYLAAKDGRLDRLDADGRGYHGVYAQ